MGPAAGVLLGLVFIAAGAAKLASPLWTAQAAGLGAPAPVARMLPYVEIALGATLVSGLARTVAASVAVVLLVAFTSLVALRLAQGRRPPCACFGGRTPRPIGGWTVARNATFLALAVVAALA